MPRKNKTKFWLDPDFKGEGKRRGKRGRRAVLRRIEKINHEKQRSGENYRSRNLILKEMGFECYKDYLRSSLWKEIRMRVLERDVFKCQICDGNATQVHHSRYHKRDLTGKNIKFLHSLCEDCHENIEFDNGKKLWMDEALKKQKKLTATAQEEKSTQQYVEKEYGYLDEEFLAMRF